MRRPSTPVFTIALIVALSGCMAGWNRPAEPVPAVFKPRQRVQVWRAGSPLVLHGVRVTADSVSGVPPLENPGCDSCRVAVRRGEVDSLRVAGTSDATAAAIAASAFLVVMGYAIRHAIYYGD